MICLPLLAAPLGSNPGWRVASAPLSVARPDGATGRRARVEEPGRNAFQLNAGEGWSAPTNGRRHFRRAGYRCQLDAALWAVGRGVDRAPVPPTEGSSAIATASARF